MDYAKKDCFAFDNGKCKALTVIECEKCNFYKNKEKHIEEVIELERRMQTATHKKMVAKIKANCHEWLVGEEDEEYIPNDKNLKGAGLKLYKLRFKLGISQKELSGRIGYVGSTAISYLEKKAKFTPAVADKLCDYFGLQEDYFEEY